ncbi:hypothetical protein AB2B41_00565 [Marimonas sp. MJW-29]|uniref:RNase NYN domain-containing protein n=1 Tax=Sulfitobacter sediminis TaxID=3234186 RepID=A0ABV3RGJ5_9RHOB
MTPQDILTPAVLALALVGYVTCFARMFWLTFAGTAVLALLISTTFAFSPENFPYWGAGACIAMAAAYAARFFNVARNRRRAVGKEQHSGAASDVVIDGTNVMYWDGEADLRTLRSVVDQLRGKGMMPFVFFDASSRHHLGDPSLDEKGFAKALGLKRNRIMVCPARTEADAFILKFAREQQLPVVSNDRFGDRAQQAKGLKLIKGGVAGGRPILEGL